VIRRRLLRRCSPLAAIALVGAAGPAQDPPAWTRPIAPVHLVGPVWYVGTEGLAAYLVKTRAGAILIDGTMADNVLAIRANVEAAGVPIRRVRLMLLSHAHFDHAGGLAGLQRLSGARLAVGAGDAAAVRTGLPPGETSYGVVRFPPARVDRAVADGGQVALGEVRLTAVTTPGHTPGCTSWRLRVSDRGRPVDVLFLCSLTVAGNRLVGNRRYPAIVADFRRTFDRLGQERANVVLPFHPESVDLLARARAARLVDAGVLPDQVAKARAAFEAELAKAP
jgi:glyoxylase-like metal-dependent hydrolase (beta-lactamase superfamily II)